ncbi:MAG: VWA domain-containing protein, partial [Hyphomicrobiales bacterium]|nr:VWA domain-containing protein [Hyphomicrobiales bacterium]
MLRSFLKDKRGNLALTSAIALLPMMVAVAAAVDYSQISRHHASLQQALDAAALATGKKLGNFQTPEQLALYSEKFFYSNIGNIDPAAVSFVFDDTNQTDGSTMLLKAQYTYPLVFGGFLTSDTHVLKAESLVKAGNDKLEIALILDNSGSMRHNARIETAKTAAVNLVNQLHTAMAASNHAEPVKFSLVPFAGHVNVGAGNQNASWMDTTGASPIHHENLNWAENPLATYQGDGTWTNAAGEFLTRFTLFDDMDRDGSGAPMAWKGCVESRPYPYFTNDEPAKLSDPETLYIPVFAPDEPDDYDGQREQITQEVIVPGETTGQLYCVEIERSQNKCRRWNDGEDTNIHSTGV